ncbi:MAG: hypothetical protein ACI9VT_002544 [Psychroserpens sp.]|jgi:hypothetical protein
MLLFKDIANIEVHRVDANKSDELTDIIVFNNSGCSLW